MENGLAYKDRNTHSIFKFVFSHSIFYVMLQIWSSSKWNNLIYPRLSFSILSLNIKILFSIIRIFNLWTIENNIEWKQFNTWQPWQIQGGRNECIRRYIFFYITILISSWENCFCFPFPPGSFRKWNDRNLLS